MAISISTDLISIITFYALIFLYLFYKRKRITTQKLGRIPVAFFLKTQSGVGALRRLGTKYERFWKSFGYAAIPIGFVGLVSGLIFLTAELVRIITTPQATAGIGLVLPGVRIPGSSIFVPFWYGIIALFIVLIVHEGAHGVVAEAWKLKIKNAGVGMFAIIPFAFVEPNEAKLKKSKIKTQLSVFAAGPFANLVAALIAFLVMTFLLAPASAQALEPTGIYIDSVDPGFPADLAGLPADVIINKVDDRTITASTDFLEYMATISPGQTVTLSSDDQDFEITTVENPTNTSKAFLGVKFRQNTIVKPSLQESYGNLPLLLIYASRLFYWIFMLNIGIGIINLLPLGPIDGGRMADLALRSVIKDKKVAAKTYTIITTFSAALLLFNILAPILLSFTL